MTIGDDMKFHLKEMQRDSDNFFSFQYIDLVNAA